ncbi:hypothetical protein [Achromobacter spanius]|uniref:Lipoprotein n=1 Tax=Achromobacter spanius TaxID=217203 RepID=A0A2S0IEM2_9BURK|nr:hypothetical protein [Achromobacter spanius]AVJ30207.1 hypothetical protein CLM73_25620 [Achromobacter spanius]
MAGILGGCAFPQGQRINQQKVDSDNVEAFCANAWADTRLDPLRSKLPAKATDATLAQLADPSLATPAQQQAINDFDPVMAQCFEMRQAYLKRYSPGSVVATFDILKADSKALRAQLWAKKITFGEYNTKAAKLLAESQKTMQTELEKAQQIAAQQQAQRDQNMMLMMPYMAPRPTITDCHRYGNSVNCITR